MLPILLVCGILSTWATVNETSRSAPQLPSWRCGPHYTSSQGLRCGSGRLVGSVMGNPDPSLFMTVEEAAERLHVMGDTIQALITRGLIRTHREYGHKGTLGRVIKHFVFKADVEARFRFVHFCSQCGKPLQRQNAKESRSNWCSNDCHFEATKIQRNSSQAIERRNEIDRRSKASGGYGNITEYGYRRIYDSVQKRLRFEHVLVWEATYGSIPVGFLIHHRNEDKLDNRIENLALVDRTTHKRLHSGCILRNGIWYKPCRKCGKRKTITSNHWQISKKGWPSSECKKCLAHRNKVWRQANPNYKRNR